MEYLSVKDFAKLAGVTKQAVYQRLNTDLSSFVKLENGKKCIAKDALQLFQSNSSKGDQESLIVKAYESTLTVLKSQLEVKDLQIKALNDRLEEMSKRLEEQVELNKNNQMLLAMEKKALTVEEPAAEAPEKKKHSFLGIFRKEKKQ